MRDVDVRLPTAVFATTVGSESLQATPDQRLRYG